MTNQAIIHQTKTTTLTFISKPAEETRKALVAAGFSFSSKSGQWYRNEVTPGLLTEEQVARDFDADESADQPAKKKVA